MEKACRGGINEREQFDVKLAPARKYGGPPKIKFQAQLLGDEIFSDPIGLTWKHGILVLKPSPCLPMEVKKQSVMSRRKQRSAFDQVSEFDRGRIVAYRDCELPFREIGSRVGRYQTTVMRICDRQESCAHGGDVSLSHITNITQHIESVTHHSVSARTIRRHLQQSGLSTRHPLLGLSLTQNHRSLCRRWCDERWMWAAEWNEVATHLFATPGWVGRVLETPWREDAEQLLYAPPHWSCTGYISKELEPVLIPYLQGLATTIFQQDNVRPHVARIVHRFFVNHQIELLPLPARTPDLSPIENMWSMVAERLTQIIPLAATPHHLCQRVEFAWYAVPQEHTQGLFESMPRRVVAMISNNGGYSGRNHT
ncbi:transposable element Tcb1 transposase [Trichonephila clavipes]|nr:transposable element Tcb1 transposase [Trichonephila clavipes]